MTVLVNSRPIKFIIDSGSPITPIPKQKVNEYTTIYPLQQEYKDVNNNKIKFEGKTMANIEMDGEKKKLITTKRTNPLLGLDWMKHPGIKLKIEKTILQIQNFQEGPDIADLKKKLGKLFNENKQYKKNRSRHLIKTRCKADTTKRPTNTDSFTTGSR